MGEGAAGSGQKAVGRNLAQKTRFHELVVQGKTFLSGLCVSGLKSFC